MGAEDDTVVLEGDVANAVAAGITVEPAARVDRAHHRAGRPVPLRERLMGTASPSRPPRRLAVVGSGVAGLTAAYVASRSAHVTLYEADDRLGGHADTHLVEEAGDGPGRAGCTHRHRLHRAQRAHLPGAAPPVRRARRRDPAVRDVDVDPRRRDRPGVGRRAGPPRAVPLARQPDPAGVPADAHRDPAVPPAGAARCWPTRSAVEPVETTLREFLADGRLLGVLRPALHGAGRRRGLVVRPGRRAGLPRPLPVHVPRPPRHARHLRLARPGARSPAVRGSTSRRVAAALDEVRIGTKVTSVLETPDGVEVTDGNGDVTTYDAVVVATHPGHALAMLAEPTPAQREVLGAMPYSPNVALLHTDTSLLPQATERAGVVELPAPPRRPDRPSRPAGDGVTVTYDLTRLQRLDTDTHYLVTLGGERPRRPGDRDRPDGVRAPALQPRLRRRPAPAAVDRHRPARVRRRLPRLGLPRGRCPLRARRRGAPGAARGRSAPALDHRRQLDRRQPTGVYRTTIRHTRRTPFPRTFEHRSHTWLVDLDDLPDHGVARPVRGARPPRRPRPLDPRPTSRRSWPATASSWAAAGS